MRLAYLLATVAVIAAAPAIGHDPDPSAPSLNGSVTLRSGFEPDPHVISVRAGGVNNAHSLGEGCTGFVANQPDYKVTYNPSNTSSLPFIISVQANSDTMLAVNGPNGTWYCDDDSGGGTNPAIRFNNPASGRYDIFVGTYNSGASAPARLRISELSSSVPSARNVDGGRRTSGGGGGSGERPNVGLDATYGAKTLNGGFTPDPFRATVTAGGELDASNLGGECRGWIARAPDYKITYNPSSGSSLPLVVSVASGSDTMLAINDANGNWYCDDDSGEGVNPAIRFTHPIRGRYDIYVGTYERGASPSAQLRVSELSSSSPSYRDIDQQGGGSTGSSDDDRPDPSAASYNGEVTLTTGFMPDPHTRRVTAGGTINAHVVGSQCSGFVGHQPDYKVTYRGSNSSNNSGKIGGGQLPLLFGVTSNADTTLAINGPDGRWYCDDDSGGGTNPLVTFAAPQSGRYDVFVGTYASGATAPATLTVSERPRR